MDGGIDWHAKSFTFPPDSSALIVAGSFRYCGQDSLPARGLAAWDGADWSIAGLGGGDGLPLESLGCLVPTMAWFHDTLFLGPYCGGYQWVEAWGKGVYLANGQWHGMGEVDLPLAMLPVNDRLFVGGDASTVNGQYMPGVREWRMDSLRPLPNAPWTLPASVYGAALWKDRIYFGGVFQVLGSRKIVSFDGVDQWEGLAGGVGGNFVSTLCGYGDSLYAGGFFLNGTDPDVYSDHVQVWDGTAWHPFFPQVDFEGSVSDIQVHGGALYISGVYHFVGDTTLYGVLRYDGQQLCALGGHMYSDHGDMAFFQDDLYLILPPQNPQLPYEFIGYLDLDTVEPDTCVQVSTGLPEAGTPVRVSVYPNPAAERVQVALSTGGNLRTVEVQDALGQVVHRQAPRAGSAVTLEVAAWPAGCYLVRVEDQHGRRGSARFIKH